MGYRASALANILLSSGTEQTVAGSGASLLEEQIFNIPPLQEFPRGSRGTSDRAVRAAAEGSGHAATGQGWWQGRDLGRKHLHRKGRSWLPAEYG